jgi:AmmeMemoRadiSam system protein A
VIDRASLDMRPSHSSIHLDDAMLNVQTGSNHRNRKPLENMLRALPCHSVLAAKTAILLSIAVCLCACVSRSRHESEATSEAPATPSARTPASAAQITQDVPQNAAYSKQDQRTLVKLARAALVRAVRDGELVALPAGLPGNLLEKKGCFVTLTEGGQLRGCIGNIFPELPLAQAVVQNARSAALNDTRFSPVTPEELGKIAIEVSILSVPSPLKFTSPEDLLQKLKPHQDGVVLSIGQRRATFLPQVWEQLPDATDFLSHLAVKAGLTGAAWRGPETQIMTYRVEAFQESEVN